MSDDLNTELRFGADTTGAEAGVNRVKRSLKDLGDSANKASKEASNGLQGVGAGGDKAAKDVERATKTMQGSLQRLLAEQKAGAKGSREYYEALADTRGISRNAIKPILDQIDAAKNKTLQAKTAADSWTASLGKVAPLVAAAFSGAAITGFLGKVVSVQREFDVLNSSLKTVTGSSAAAERELMWLKDFAKETPFGLAQATQGFVKMKALGLDPTRAALTSFGNTASAMGKDLNQMIEAVADASTGEFERLKEFGIKAKKEGDNVSLTFQGVTTTIGNSAAEITKYLEDIGNAEFGGAMAERAKTLDGTIAALGDTWDELFRTVSDNQVGSLIFDAVTLANGAIEDATTIIRAFGGASSDAAKDSGALAAMQTGVATFFETVAVMAAQTLYVLRQTGDTLGGLAAGYKAFFSFDFDAVRAIGAEMRANGEAARKEIDATTARILNARKAQEEYARFATRNASAATDPRRVDLGGATTATARAASAGVSKAVKEVASEYDKLIKKLGDELPKAAAEAESAQMGYNKSQAEFVALAGSPVWASFTNSQRAVVASMFEGKIASEQAGDAAKELSKAYAEAAAERIKTIQSMERAADGLQSQNDALREEIELIGLSTEQQTLVLQQRNDVIILTKEATLAELERQSAITGTQTRVEIALASEIEALKERNALLGAKGVKNAAVDAAKSAADEWQKTTDSINQSLTDSLLRGFESGKDFAKNLRDTVVNMFKTMVLRPIISAIVSPVAGLITGGLGLAGGASAATSGASGLGMLGNVGSLISAGLGTFGTAAGYGASALLAGNGLGALAGGASMVGAGSLAGGFGMIAGVLGPIALGIGALVAIAKATKGETRTGGQFGVSFDGTVTNNRRDQVYTYQGQQFDRDFSNGERNALIAGQAYRLEGDPVAQESAIRDAVSGTARGIDAFLEALGSKARLTGFSAGLETSGKGRGGVFAGGTLDNGANFGESGKGDNYEGTLFEKFSTNSPDFKTALENFTLDLKQSTIQALQSVTDIPNTVKKMIADVDAEGLSEEAANAILETINAQIIGVGQLQNAFEAMGLDELAKMGFDAAAGLAAAAGGFDQLQANLNTYYDNFFTEEEKRANLQERLDKEFAELGIDVPKTRDEYRRITEEALGQVEIQQAAKDKLSATISEGVKGSFSIEDLGKTGLLAGVDPALIGGGEADPANAGKLNDFLEGVNDLLGKGLDPAAFEAGLAGLVDVNSEVLGIGKDADKTAAALLGMSGVFSQILAAEEAAAARIAEQRESLGDRLLKAQGKDRELLDLQRKREFDALTKLDPELGKLVTQIYELEDASKRAADAEADRVATIDKSLRNLGAAYAREQKLMESQLDGLDQYRTFVEQQQSLQQESLGLISGVFDVLKSSVQDLYGSVASTAAMQAEQGRQFIAQALGTALSTGYLPDRDQLSEAIQAARAGIDSGNYANTAEQDFAKLVLAGQLRAVEEVAGKQKTDAEKQLEALKKQLDSIDDQTDAINKQIKLQQESLDYWQEQIDIANGVYDATLSVADAIRALSKSLGFEVTDNIKAPVAVGSGPAFGPGGGAEAQTPARYSRLISGGTAGVGYEGIREESLIARLDKLAPVYRQFDGTGDLVGLATAFKGAGGTIADLSILSGNFESDWRKAFASVGIPAFAVGTNYVPRDMLAQIHEGEAIVPKAFNPWANGGASTSGGNTALISELRALRAEVAELRAATEDSAASAGTTADVLVRVTQNGNGMVTAAAPI